MSAVPDIAVYSLISAPRGAPKCLAVFLDPRGSRMSVFIAGESFDDAQEKAVRFWLDESEKARADGVRATSATAMRLASLARPRAARGDKRKGII